MKFTNFTDWSIFKKKEGPMKQKSYKPRYVDRKVEECLGAMGALCIEGPKWVGKTWTAMEHCHSSIFLGDPAGNFQNRNLARIDPSLVLSGNSPRLIDEWQEVPPLWDAVRFAVDQTGMKGRFILTGSATPQRKGILHSGAGRIATLRMRPMSLYEAGNSSGDISLKEICEGNPISPRMTGNVKLEDLAEMIIRGGWPGNQDTPAESAGLVPKAYIEAILNEDIQRIDEKRRDIQKISLLLRSLARNESTTAASRSLRRDIAAIDGEQVDINTVTSYMEILNRLFLLDNQRPFAPSVRSSIRVKQAEKHHFADPSLAAAILGLNPEKLIGDLETFGFLFEALCERDLRIYAESFGGELYHYQDYRNQEIDAVIEMPDGSWAAVEIKLGANQIDSAAENLLKIKGNIESAGGKGPSSLIVLCGLSAAAYQRPDGVYVVPLTAIKA